MASVSLLEPARCEICGQDDPLLLGAYVLGRDQAGTILCQSHAAPAVAGIADGTGGARRPTRSELFAFWEERRPGIVWLSPERRLLRDRRGRARGSDGGRRRVLR